MPNTPTYNSDENRFVRHDTLEQDLATSADALTALAGGAQAGLALVNGINRVTVVATIGDSCQLPLAAAGGHVIVINGSATSMNVFPQTGDNINALAANAAFALAAGKSVEFCAAGPLHWSANLTA